MNWLTISVIIFLLLSALWSAKRGFLKSLIGMISLVLLLVLTIVLTRPIAEVMNGSENMNAFAKTRAEHFLDGQMDSIEENGKLPGWMSLLPMPEETQAMLSGDDAGILVALLKTGLLRDLLVTQLAGVFLRLFAILAAFVFALLLIILLRVLLHIFVKLPGVKTVDRTLGFIFGLLKAVLIIWVFFAVLRALSEVTELTLVKMIHESAFLQIFYTMNPIYNLIANA